MKCKYCGSDNMERRPVPPHIGVYCVACGKWQCWEKHTDNPKTAEQYRDEYLNQQPATTQQIRYIQKLARDLKPEGVSKLMAGKIIDLMKLGEPTC